MWAFVLSVVAAFISGAVALLAAQAYLVHVFYVSKAAGAGIGPIKPSRLRDHIDVVNDLSAKNVSPSLASVSSATFEDIARKRLPPHETCDWLNILLAFIFRYIRDTDAADEFFQRKIRVEFDELLATAAGKVIEDIRVREYRMGECLPLFSQARILIVEADELVIAVDVAYEGGFQVVLDADLVFGMGASLSVTLASLRGRVRLRLAGTPRPHWSFAFYEEPEIEFKVESILNGRPMPHLTTLIVNQFRRSIRKKHTLPSFKPRQLVPSIAPRGPPLTPAEVIRESCKRLVLGLGHLHAARSDCRDSDTDYVLVDGNPLLSGVLRVRVGKLSGLPLPIQSVSGKEKDKDGKKDESKDLSEARPVFVEMEAECGAASASAIDLDMRVGSIDRQDRRIYSRHNPIGEGQSHAVLRTEPFSCGCSGEADADAEAALRLGADSTSLLFRVYCKGRTAKEPASAQATSSLPHFSAPFPGALLCAKGEVFLEDIILEITAGGNHSVHRRIYLDTCGGKDVWGNRTALDPAISITVLFSFEPRPSIPNAATVDPDTSSLTGTASKNIPDHLSVPDCDQRSHSAPGSPVAACCAVSRTNCKKGLPGLTKRDSDSLSLQSSDASEPWASDCSLHGSVSVGRLPGEETTTWHRFAIDKFSAPLPRCEYCGGKVWRMKAFQCQACKYICHQKCLAECVRNTVCPKARVFQEQQQFSFQQQQVQLQQHEHCGADDISGSALTEPMRSKIDIPSPLEIATAESDGASALRSRTLTESIENLQCELDTESERRDSLARMLQSTSNRREAEAVRRQLQESLGECELRMQHIAMRMLRQLEDGE